MSIDGMVEVGGRSSPLGGAADRAAFMAMRAVADAILVGAGTARQENYGPGAARVRRDRTPARAGPGRPPGAGDRQQPSRSVSDRPGVHRRPEAAGAHLRGVGRPRSDLAGSAELVVCGAKEVDLAVALDELSDRGLPRVLCEGGPTLLRSLLEAPTARRAVRHDGAGSGRSRSSRPAGPAVVLRYRAGPPERRARG